MHCDQCTSTLKKQIFFDTSNRNNKHIWRSSVITYAKGLLGLLNTSKVEHFAAKVHGFWLILYSSPQKCLREYWIHLCYLNFVNTFNLLLYRFPLLPLKMNLPDGNSFNKNKCSNMCIRCLWIYYENNYNNKLQKDVLIKKKHTKGADFQ